MLSQELVRPFLRCRHLRRATRAARKANAIRNMEVTYSPKSCWLPLYKKEDRPPFTPVASYGPWIVTEDGGYVYDAGGYGMLSLGHNPTELSRALSREYHQANVMVESSEQADFLRAVEPHIGSRVIACLNSGSEANSLAMRISNSHHSDASVIVALQDSFHGRTEGPALASSSSHEVYREHLAAFRTPIPVVTLTPNCVDSVHATYNRLADQGIFPELAVLEPVMGEGRPALSITPEFYEAVYRRTHAAGGMVLVDSVQAGLRCHGVLSITDYPGFECAPRPHMESFSKAIHSGQFPVSMLALTKHAALRYQTGTYGNSMSANPRGLAVVTACLNAMTPSMREHIREMGTLLLTSLIDATRSVNVLDVRGAGLLVAIDLHPRIDAQNFEKKLRTQGLNVIRGGKNSIRLTPWFRITPREIRLICKVIRAALSGE